VGWLLVRYALRTIQLRAHQLHTQVAIRLLQIQDKPAYGQPHTQPQVRCSHNCGSETEWITPGESGYTVCFGCGEKTYFVTDEYVKGYMESAGWDRH
jgi:hypothetical protein